MVFTHMPSNAFLIGVAFASTPLTAVFFLLCRKSLSQMAVPARQSYVMAIVDESDRTAAAGLTSTTRTVSSSISPSLAGYALANLWLGVPLVAAGILKLAYDALIYKEFRQVRPPEERAVSPKCTCPLHSPSRDVHGAIRTSAFAVRRSLAEEVCQLRVDLARVGPDQAVRSVLDRDELASLHEFRHAPRRDGEGHNPVCRAGAYQRGHVDAFEVVPEVRR